MYAPKNALAVCLAAMVLAACSTTEIEFLDSVSGQHLAAMVERKKGSPVNLAGGFTELGHAKAAFRAWASDLKLALTNNP